MKRILLENRTGDLKSEIPLSTPYVVFIDPSSCCNFKCTFCMNGQLTSRTIMTMTTFRKVIDSLQAFPKPVKTVRLYGFGEPLLNKNFPDMVAYAKASSKVERVDTTTNASLLTPNVSRSIVDAGIDRVNISIEGMSTGQYREFTGNQQVFFDDIVDNVADMYAVRGKTTVFVKACGDYLSQEEKDFFYTTFSPISDGCDLEHTMNCWSGFEVEGVNTEVGIYGQPLSEVQVCPYVFYTMYVHADGDVSPCFLDWKKDMVMGNVLTQNLVDLWGCDYLKNLQTAMISKQRCLMKDQCSKCSQLVAGMPVDLDEQAEEIAKRILSQGTCL